MRNQSGAGLIGMLVLLSLVGIVAFAGVQIVPSFMQNWVVQRAMAHALTAGADATDADIRQKFQTNLKTNDVEVVTGRDMVIDRTSAGLRLSVVYSVRKPFIGPVGFIIDFESSVPAR
jgi:type II secretory pathway pseudopilin PulG